MRWAMPTLLLTPLFMLKPNYIGRFAPTPTGLLHFGSLVAALASYLDAKANNGTWLLRIEDLDPPREDKAASQLIPQQLIAHGLLWDEGITYQSQNSHRYEHALEQLEQQGLLFPCTCSRKDLQKQQGRHLGNCHSQYVAGQAYAWRLAVPDAHYEFTDRIYGHVRQNLKNQVGDFVLKRKDGLYAYQLAMVLDDHAAGITHVVRGLDLLDNTPRQLYLLRSLGFPVPEYLHVPLIVNKDGQKLSKQNKAAPLNLNQPKDNLLKALAFLKQEAPNTEACQSVSNILQWATEYWSVSSIPADQFGL